MLFYQGPCSGKTGMFLRDLTEPIGGHVNSTRSTPPTTTLNTDQPPQTSSTNTPAQNSANQSHMTNGYTSVVDGKALFDFQGQSSAELSLIEGQIVTNIKLVDGDWSEGSSNGQTGIFPTLYVELLDSGTSTQEPMPGSSLPVSVLSPPDSISSPPVSVLSPPDSISSPPDSLSSSPVSVLYDFEAENAEEVTLTAGQSVTIIREDVQGWVRVRTSSGVEGLCPLAFLQRPADGKESNGLEINGSNRSSSSEGW